MKKRIAFIRVKEVATDREKLSKIRKLNIGRIGFEPMTNGLKVLKSDLILLAVKPVSLSLLTILRLGSLVPLESIVT